MTGRVKPVPPQDGFTSLELNQDRPAFMRLANARRDSLAPEVRAWLAAWNRFDLAISPMPDVTRMRLRYGHYVGWFARYENDKAYRDSAGPV